MDAELFRLLYSWLHRPVLDPFWSGITHLGDKGVVLALAAGGLAQVAWLRASVRRSSGRGKQGVPLLAPWLGIGIAACVVGWLKGLLNRPRPFEVIEGMTAASLEGGLSFPSGHTTLAFALATAAGIRWPHSRAVGFGLAAAVALSRVALGLHWPSDLLGGAVLGWGVVSGVSWMERIGLTRRG